MTKLIPICIVAGLLLSSCAVKNMVTGEYYLGAKDYKGGIAAFDKEVAARPGIPRNHYYLARYHLADNQLKKGLAHIKKAVTLDPNNPDYLFWQGVTYGAIKQPKAEWTSYESALKIDPGHTRSRLYLAHTQLDRKQYAKALSNYETVIKKWPEDPSSLYNRALILGRLDRRAEARAGWKIYLSHYSMGNMAINAVKHLNALGDFTYRNHLIGVRTLSMHRIEFKPFTLILTKHSRTALNHLGRIMDASGNVSVHIIAYQRNNGNLAEKKAKEIKKYLLQIFPGIDSARLKVSWFGQSEKKRINKRNYYIDESVRFVTAI